MTKKKAKIYAYKNDGKIIYIGKSIMTNPSGEFTKSTPNVGYCNNEIRKQITFNNKASIEVLEEVSVENWFDPKLNQIVDKYKNGAKLLNAKHLLDGKRGYWEGTGGFWEGKKRDSHTLNQLSKSKYKTLLQYDVNGNFIKEWDSIKEAAIEVFDDYQIINGSGDSQLYTVINNQYLKNRLAHDSYWVRYEELTTTKIPIKLYLDKILKTQEINRKKKIKESRIGVKYINRNHKGIYQIDENDKKIKSFKSTKFAAKELGIDPASISRCCRYLTNSACDGKYRFMFRKIEHREKYYDNKVLLSAKLLK